MHVRLALVLPVLLAACSAVAGDAPAAFPPECGRFTRDVTNELAALRLPSIAVVAGRGDDAGATRIEPGTRHDIRLHPQRGVTLATAPGKAVPDHAMAGLLVFRVPEDGRYRVSLTTAHWVDVVDGGRVLASLDHEGRRGCPLLRKVVEFELAAGRDLVLQLVGPAADETGVVITAAPAGAE